VVPPFELRRATLTEILGLRHTELRAGLPAESAHFEGDGEADTFHCGAFHAGGGGIVGCVTLVPRPRDGVPAWQLRGMATRSDLVRCGIGSALLRFALETLRVERGHVLVWCNARVTAVPFYAKQGWEVVSEVFDIPTAGPHRVMIRR
jgi:GNAT superfamily N-acetyltransferase